MQMTFFLITRRQTSGCYGKQKGQKYNHPLDQHYTNFEHPSLYLQKIFATVKFQQIFQL